MATSRETVRAGTVARVHERLCPHRCLASQIRDPAPVPLYDVVAALRQTDPGVTVAGALALIRECDGW